MHNVPAMELEEIERPAPELLLITAACRHPFASL
jgi:hypothetical protein